MEYKLIFNDGSTEIPNVFRWFWLDGTWHRSGPYNTPAKNTLYAIGDKPDFNPDSEVLVMRGGDNAMEVAKYREGCWRKAAIPLSQDTWAVGDDHIGHSSKGVYATKDCPLSPTEAHALISPERPVLDLAKIQALGHSEPVQYEERARVWRGLRVESGYAHWRWNGNMWLDYTEMSDDGTPAFTLRHRENRDIFVPADGPKPTLPPPPPDRILSVNSLEALEESFQTHVSPEHVWGDPVDKEIKKALDTHFEIAVRRKRPSMIKQTAKTIATQSAVNAIHTRAVEAASFGLQKAGIPKEVVEAPAFQVALSLALPLLVQGACQYRLLSSNGLPEGIESKLGYAASMATATTGVQLLSPVFSQIVSQVTPFLDQIELPEASGAVERIEEDE